MKSALYLLVLLVAACGQETMVVTLAGSTEPGYVDGSGTAARFQTPSGIVVDAEGVTYVADAEANAIRRVDSDGAVTTVVRSLGSGFIDGPPGVAMLFLPIALAIDTDGSLLVGEGGNHAVREIDPVSGVATTLVGGEEGYVDGDLDGARFGAISGIAIDRSTGVIYVTDSGNHAVRRIDRAAGVVSTVAGSGAAGFADGAGAGASFDRPVGIAFDGEALFVADSLNHCIRRIDRDGVVSTIAGRPGVSGYAEGQGDDALFHRPWGVALGPGGALYVADSWNHVIRVVASDGSTRRIAGLVPRDPTVLPNGEDGAASSASFRLPSHLDTWEGGIVVAESARIRTILP